MQLHQQFVGFWPVTEGDELFSEDEESDPDGSELDPGSEDYAADYPQPAVNPFRDVGRNDPCPCGSGKKFKKCCLARVRAGEPIDRAP